MADSQHLNLGDEKNFCQLLQGITDLQSSASDINIERQDKQSSIFQEECDKSTNNNNKDDEESLKIIKQTTDIARLAMTLLVRGLLLCSSVASRKAKCFNTFSSAISYIRQQEDAYKPPKHLLLQWERNIQLIDMFTNDDGLYCNKRIAQDMFDICMETFDWLRSLSNNNK